MLANAGARAAAILEAIPGSIRRRNAALNADDLAMIGEEIAKARNLVAAMSLDDLNPEG